MDKGDWGLLGGTGILGTLVTALGILVVRRKNSEDVFQNSQQNAQTGLLAIAIQERDKAQEQIRDMRTMLKAADERANKLEMHLHEYMYRNRALKRDLDKLAVIVRTSERAEVLDYIQHTEFGALGEK